MNRYEASDPTPPRPTLRDLLEELCVKADARDKRVSVRLIRKAMEETP